MFITEWCNVTHNDVFPSVRRQELCLHTVWQSVQTLVGELPPQFIELSGEGRDQSRIAGDDEILPVSLGAVGPPIVRAGDEQLLVNHTKLVVEQEVGFSMADQCTCKQTCNNKILLCQKQELSY